MPVQKALYLVEAKGALEVRERDIPAPGPGEILVEVHATGLNPVDWKIQTLGIFLKKYPAILGTDAAGIVKAVGEGVTTLAVGDKVLHQGTLTLRNATFQQYTIVPAEIAAKVPDNITLDEAASIPVGLGTAALAFYNPKPAGCGLEFPWEVAGRGKYSDQPLLVIGGASSVGQHVLQFGKLSGFSPIITTASVSNEVYLKSLGATHVIDRSIPLSSLSSEIAKITSAPVLYAYDSISYKDTQEAAYDILAPGGTLILVTASVIDDDKRSGDKTIINVFGSTYPESNRPVAVSLYSKLTELISTGQVKPNHVEVLPGGLNGVQAGLDKLKNGGVHASKLVVRPQETA